MDYTDWPDNLAGKGRGLRWAEANEHFCGPWRRYPSGVAPLAERLGPSEDHLGLDRPVRQAGIEANGPI